jgi:hypothetical protein
MNTILLDALFGAIIIGSFSYFSNLYIGDKRYIKIMAFLWGIPAIYFYLLRISARNGKEDMIHLSKHALLGVLGTLLAILFTLYFRNTDKNILIIYNLLYLVTCIFLYFHFKVYNLI